MIVSTLIEKLQSMPQHMQVLIDVSRTGDNGFVFTVPDKVDVVEDPGGQEFVFIGSWQEVEDTSLN